MSRKSRICLMADVPGWAFDVNLRDLKVYLEHKFDFDIRYIIDNQLPSKWDYDLVYWCFHRWYRQFITRPILSSCKSRYLFTDERLCTRPEDFAFVNNNFLRFHFVEQNGFNEFKPYCPRSFYLTNPVNMRRFTKQSPLKNEIIVEWNGNANHMSAPTKDVKGFHSIVLPAIADSRVKFNYAEFNTRKKDYSSMPEFYQQANVALSASLFEGASNSVMEAMASGLAVICTDVGNHREMHESMLSHFGASGMMIVDRDVDSFSEAIKSLTSDKAYEMGILNRREIAERWSWDAWADRYAEFFGVINHV